MKKSYIGQAWLVILLSLCFGAALATIQITLNPKIEQNKLTDTIGQIPALVPGAASGSAETVGGRTVYRATDAQGGHIGWVLPAHGQGFADVIEVLIGLDPKAERITGLSVLKQLETPGLGDNITKPDWLGQFMAKPVIAPLQVGAASGADNAVEAVTGATVSSQSVVDIVNIAVAEFRAALGGVQP